MTISNLAAFDAAIRAVCPAIDGVAADGHIYFQASATPGQIAAANAAAASYVDPPAAMALDMNALAALLVAKAVISPADMTAVHKSVSAVVLPTIAPLPPPRTTPF